MFSQVKLDVEKTKAVFGYDPSELKSGSHEKVVVECVSCHRIIHREYRNINRYHQCPVVSGDLKKCFRCNKWKDLSLFNKNPKGSAGVSKMCRECHNSHPSVIKTEKNRIERRKRAIETGEIEYYINFRIRSIKNSAKRKNIPFDIDAKFMHELWRKQEGKCYYTGLLMAGKLKCVGFQSWDGPSVDRKNPANGYVKDNVVWCIFGVNSFKQSLNEEQFLDLIKQIKWWDV